MNQLSPDCASIKDTLNHGALQLTQEEAQATRCAHALLLGGGDLFAVCFGLPLLMSFITSQHRTQIQLCNIKRDL